MASAKETFEIALSIKTDGERELKPLTDMLEREVPKHAQEAFEVVKEAAERVGIIARDTTILIDELVNFPVAETEFSEYTNTLGEDFQEMSDKVQTILSDLFTPYAPAVEGFATTSIDVLDSMDKIWQGANSTKKIADAMTRTIVGGNTTFKQLATTVLSKVAPSLVVTNTATGAATISFRALWTAATGPVGIVIGALIAIAGTLVLLYNKVEPVRKVMDMLWQGMQDAWSMVLLVFEALWEVIEEVGALVFEYLIIPFEILWGVLEPLVSTLWDSISALLGMAETARENVDIMATLQKVTNFVRSGLLKMKGVVRGLTLSFQEFKNMVVDLWNAITSLRFDKLGDILMGGAQKMGKAFEEGFKGAITDVDETEEEIEESTVKITRNFKRISKGAKDTASDLKKSFNEIKKELQNEQSLELAQMEFMDATESEKLAVKLDYLNQTIAAAKKYKQDTTALETQAEILQLKHEKKLTEELRKENEARYQIRAEIDKGARDLITQQSEFELSAQEAQFKRTIEDAKKRGEDTRALEADLQRKMAVDRAALDKKLREEESLARLEEEKHDLLLQFQNKDITKSEYDLLLEQKHAAHLNRLKQLDLDYEQAIIDAKQASSDKKKEIQESDNKLAIDGMKSVLGDLASASEEQFELNKAFKISEALIDTYLAAQRAYTSLAAIQPLAIAAAAAATAAGLANVAKIREQKPSFASGGYTGDVPANQIAGFVHGREHVSDAATTAKYRDGLEKLNAGMTPEEAFNLQTPGAPPQSGLSNIKIGLDGKFVMSGDDLVLVVEKSLKSQYAGTA